MDGMNYNGNGLPGRARGPRWAMRAALAGVVVAFAIAAALLWSGDQAGHQPPSPPPPRHMQLG